jgi:hypothetical protein
LFGSSSVRVDDIILELAENFRKIQAEGSRSGEEMRRRIDD